MANERQFKLPGKVDTYLATMSRMYEKAGEAMLLEIVVNGAPSIEEGVEHDNWDGGIDGHCLTLNLPEDLFLRAAASKEKLQDRETVDCGEE